MTAIDHLPGNLQEPDVFIRSFSSQIYPKFEVEVKSPLLHTT
jgi:hypothetical protein